MPALYSVMLRMRCPRCETVVEARPWWTGGQRSFTCRHCGAGVEPHAVEVRRAVPRDDLACALLWEELRRNAEFPTGTDQ